MVQRQSINSLIAWLSVCLLAAAWGPKLGLDQQLVWTYFGLFGLAAALGLDTLARTRQGRLERSRQERLTSAQQRRLKQFDDHGRSGLAIREAMRRIAEDALLHDQPSGAPAADLALSEAGPGKESRHGCWIPVRLFPAPDVSESESSKDDEEQSIAAYIRDISASGVGLCHAGQVDAPEAVVRVALSNGDQIAMLATRCWCRPGELGWHLSGWKLSAVLTQLHSQPVEAWRSGSVEAAYASLGNGHAVMAECPVRS